MNPGRNMGKTNPLNDNDLVEFIALQKTRPETEKSWLLPVIVSEASVIAKEERLKQSPDSSLRETKQSLPSSLNGFDLSVKNPNTPEEAPLRSPQEILDEMTALDEDTKELLDGIRELL
jgi:type I restriction enzyme M protein